MKRLYLQIYLAFLVILVSIVISAALLSEVLRNQEQRVWANGVVQILASDLPNDLPPDRVLALLEERSSPLPLDFAIGNTDGHIIASTGEAWPNTIDNKKSWGGRFGPPVIRVRLDGERWLGLRVRRSHERQFGLFGVLLSVGLMVASGAYPLARRIPVRLEAVRRGVENFGAGDLAARVPFDGNDEVAAVARSFNDAAERIQTLVESEQRLLANASHELRSPLARLSVAVDLMHQNPGASRYRKEAERSIQELDDLVGDVLLGSRLEAQGDRQLDPPVDLGALVEEVCRREGVPCRSNPVVLRGDGKALRRMVANLIDNARHHGGGEIEVSLEGAATHAFLRVLDRGPGVAEPERARVFEAFYRGSGVPDRTEGGTGLGLALVRQIARYHGGDASMDARPGGGCVVLIELPIEAA